MHTRSSGDICRENATIVQEVTTRKLPAWRQLDNSVKRSKVLFFEKKNRPHIILGQEISKRNWKIPATYFPKICIFQWKSESDYIYPRLLGMTTTGVDTIKNAQLDHITQVAPWRDTQERLLNSCIHQKSVVFQEIYYLADLKNQILKILKMEN